MPREWRFRIEDMLRSLEGIREDLEGLTYEAFLDNRTVRNSVVRELEIIGEAARFVPPNIEAAYPEIPWADIRGMRNMIAHEYFGLDWNIIWETANSDLPVLEPFLQRILVTSDGDI